MSGPAHRLLISRSDLRPSTFDSTFPFAEPGQSIPRASAIAAVGRLANPEQLPWLERQSTDGNPSVKLAAEAAAKQIRSRIKG